jgi:large subunit ribosomal protein L25
MSDLIALQAKKRKIIGKKVKQLRHEGQIPAVVYGPDSDPLPIQADGKELRQVLLEAGGTQLIELHVGKDKIPTLAREVQRDPVRGEPLHVDFYRVAMDRAIRAEVPVLVVNEPGVVTSGAAIVVHPLTSLEIEALPADLPPHIEVDMSELTEIGDQLLVGDLDLPDTLTMVSSPEELVVRIDYAATLELEEEEEEEELLEEMLPGEVEVITERREEEAEEEE